MKKKFKWFLIPLVSVGIILAPVSLVACNNGENQNGTQGKNSQTSDSNGGQNNGNKPVKQNSGVPQNKDEQNSDTGSKQKVGNKQNSNGQSSGTNSSQNNGAKQSPSKQNDGAKQISLQSFINNNKSEICENLSVSNYGSSIEVPVKQIGSKLESFLVEKLEEIIDPAIQKQEITNFRNVPSKITVTLLKSDPVNGTITVQFNIDGTITNPLTISGFQIQPTVNISSIINYINDNPSLQIQTSSQALNSLTPAIYKDINNALNSELNHALSNGKLGNVFPGQTIPDLTGINYVSYNATDGTMTVNFNYGVQTTKDVLVTGFQKVTLAQSFIWLSGTQDNEGPWYQAFGGIGFNPQTMKVTYNFFKNYDLLPAYATGGPVSHTDYSQNYTNTSVFYKTKSNFELFKFELLDSNGSALQTFTVNTNTLISDFANAVNNWTFSYGDQIQLSFNPQSRNYPFSFIQTINAVNGKIAICASPSLSTVQSVAYWELNATLSPQGLTNVQNELINNYGSPQYQTSVSLKHSEIIPESSYRSAQGDVTSDEYIPSFVGSVWLNPFYVKENGSPASGTPFSKTTDAMMRNFLAVTGSAFTTMENAANSILKKYEGDQNKQGYDLDVANALLWWVYHDIRYNESKAGWYNATQTLENKEGVCFNKALILAELLSYIGFPCELMSGAAFSQPNNYVSDQGFHAWDQAYLPQMKKWVTFDPTFGFSNESTTSGHFNRANQFVSVTLWNPDHNYLSYFSVINEYGNQSDQNAYYLMGGVGNQSWLFWTQCDQELLAYIASLFKNVSA